MEDSIATAASFGPAFVNGALGGIIAHSVVLGLLFIFTFVSMRALQQKYAHTSSVMLSAQILGNVAMIGIFTLHRFGVSSFYYLEPTTGNYTEFYFLVAFAVFWAASNYNNWFNMGVSNYSPAMNNTSNDAAVLMSYSAATIVSVVSFVWVLFGAGISLYRPTEYAFGILNLATTIVYVYMLMSAYNRMRVFTKKAKKGVTGPSIDDPKSKKNMAYIFQYLVILRNLLVALVILIIFCLGPSLGGQIADADMVLIAYTVCSVVVGGTDVIVYYLTNIRRSRVRNEAEFPTNANVLVNASYSSLM